MAGFPCDPKILSHSPTLVPSRLYSLVLQQGWVRITFSSPIVIAECPSVSLTVPPDSSTRIALAWLPPCPLLCWIHACSTLTVQFLGLIQLLYLLLPNCLDILKRESVQREQWIFSYFLLTTSQLIKINVIFKLRNAFRRQIIAD